MKKSRYADTQIVNILKQNQAGESAANLCREYGMSQATFYKWRSKYGDADVNIVKRLKKMYADERLMSQIRLEALEGKF